MIPTPGFPDTGLLAVDVIVIGGGLSGGLPAAAGLQKAGLQVLIAEATVMPNLGRSAARMRWPQVLDSPHVGSRPPVTRL